MKNPTTMKSPTTSVEPSAILRAKRFDKEITVQAKTFGARDIFRLKTINISRSGLLLLGEHASLPFQVNTLLELAIEPHGGSKGPIDCLGKVVRVVKSPGQDSPKDLIEYGVKILETQNYQNPWGLFMVRYEEQGL